MNVISFGGEVEVFGVEFPSEGPSTDHLVPAANFAVFRNGEIAISYTDISKVSRLIFLPSEDISAIVNVLLHAELVSARQQGREPVEFARLLPPPKKINRYGFLGVEILNVDIEGTAASKVEEGV